MTVLRHALPVALLMATGVASAGTSSGDESHNMFKKMDTDGDGAITMQEAQGTKLEENFKQLDADANGKLSKDEVGMGGPETEGKAGMKDKGSSEEMNESGSSGSSEDSGEY